MMVQSEFEQERATLVAEILPLMKAHCRIAVDDAEDALCNLYIAGAIAAAENYLMRDVYPTTRKWTGDLPVSSPLGRLETPFEARHGRARTVAVTTGEGESAVVVDTVTVRASKDPKTWGFEVTPSGDLTGLSIQAELGFPTFAEMPPDLQTFILAAAGALYEVRELSNPGGSIGSQEAKFLPLYLLDTWANLTYA